MSEFDKDLEQYKKQTKKAATLKYDVESDSAPHLTAFGSGYVAEKMIASAKDKNVAVVENKALTHALGKLDIGEEIPEELYSVVAEVLVFISTLDKEYRDRIIQTGSDRG